MGPVIEPDEWMKRLGSLPLVHRPGEKWMYNTGSDVLGVLMARATGRRLEEFLKERLFEPLGLKDTAFHVPAHKLDRLPARGTGTSAYTDPAEELIGILLTQRYMTSPVPPAVFRDFWTGAYQAIDD